MERLFSEMCKYYAGNPQQIQHFTKVHSYARFIGLGEKLEAETLQILEIAAIVHDIGIKPAMEKHGSGIGKYQELEGPPAAKAMLEGLAYPQHLIERVCYLVGHHHTYRDINGPDYQMLVEADFLVNMYESQMSENSIKSILQKVFRTATGRKYCELLFAISM